jgi:NAD(P)H-dependent FMN reductase
MTVISHEGVQNEVVQKWTAVIAQSDGFDFVTPEAGTGR